MSTLRTRKKAPIKSKTLTTKTSKARLKKEEAAHEGFRSDPVFASMLDLANRALQSLSVSPTARAPAGNSVNRQPVLLPTGAQVVETKQRIQKAQKEVAFFDRECHELERKLEVARAQRSQLAHEVVVWQSSISIAQRLPHDIITMICNIHVKENRQSPWTLMHVNNAWRATALATPTIWAGVEITTIKWALMEYPRSRDGREICGTLEQFQRALTRAKGTPLDIKLNSDGPPGPEEWSDVETSELSGIINFIYAFKDRIVINSLETSGRYFYKFPSTALTTLSPSSLASLKIGTGSISVDIMNLWAKTAKNLRALEFNRPLVMCFDHKQVWWSKLEQLKIYNTFEAFSYTESCRLQDILELTVSLRYLDLDNCFPSADYWDCVFPYPHLEKLCLRDVNGMHPVDSPGLKHLKLEHSWLWGRLPLEFPQLTYLEVTRFREEWRPIVAPSLHTLVIGDNESKTANADFLEKIWPKGPGLGEGLNSYLDPVILHLRKMPISAQSLASRLRALTRLEELRLEEMDITPSLIHGITPNKSGVPCQRLKEIKVVLKQNVDVGKVRSTIQSMAQSRAQAEFPLQDVKLRVVDADEWLNLLP